MATPTQLGDYLRGLRKEKGYNIRELGDLVGCSHGLITAIENGRRTPSLRRLWDIIKALEGDFNWALYYLCIDADIPAEAVERLISGDG